MHVAEIDFEKFFESAFPGKQAAEFVRCVEGIPAEESKAKVVVHQAARMLWLGDRIEEVAHGRPALQILFYLIAAEAVAKMAFQFTGDGQSRAYVRRFFEEICTDGHHRVLLGLFSPNEGGKRFTPRDVIDLLYEIRCDVAHEGQYYLFSMPRPELTTPLINQVGGCWFITRGPIEDLRQVVLEGALLGARLLLPSDVVCGDLL